MLIKISFCHEDILHLDWVNILDIICCVHETHFTIHQLLFGCGALIIAICFCYFLSKNEDKNLKRSRLDAIKIKSPVEMHLNLLKNKTLKFSNKMQGLYVHFLHIFVSILFVYSSTLLSLHFLSSKFRMNKYMVANTYELCIYRYKQE